MVSERNKDLFCESGKLWSSILKMYLLLLYSVYFYFAVKTNLSIHTHSGLYLLSKIEYLLFGYILSKYYRIINFLFNRKRHHYYILCLEKSLTFPPLPYIQSFQNGRSSWAQEMGSLGWLWHMVYVSAAQKRYPTAKSPGLSYSLHKMQSVRNRIFQSIIIRKHYIKTLWREHMP